VKGRQTARDRDALMDESLERKRETTRILLQNLEGQNIKQMYL